MLFIRKETFTTSTNTHSFLLFYDRRFHPWVFVKMRKLSEWNKNAKFVQVCEWPVWSPCNCLTSRHGISKDPMRSVAQNPTLTATSCRPRKERRAIFFSMKNAYWNLFCFISNCFLYRIKWKSRSERVKQFSKLRRRFGIISCFKNVFMAKSSHPAFCLSKLVLPDISWIGWRIPGFDKLEAFLECQAKLWLSKKWKLPSHFKTYFYDFKMLCFAILLKIRFILSGQVV